MINSGRAIFLNTLYQMAGKVGTSLLGVISFGILARYLQTQMGEYALINSFVGFIIVFADLGLGTLLTREVAGKKADRRYISEIFTLRLILSLLITVIGSFIIFLLPYSLTIKIGVVIFLIANILYNLTATIWSVFQGALNFDKVVITQVISSLVSCILTVLFVFLKLSLLFFIIAPSIGIILSFIVTYHFLKEKISLNFDPVLFWEILKEAWPIGAGVIVSIVYFKIDSLILPFYYNPAEHPDLGYYSVAYKIFEVAIVFGGFYTGTLFPVISSYIHKKTFKKDFIKYFTYTFILAFLGGFTLFIFARIFILILAGDSFANSIGSLRILSLAAFSSILSGYFISIGVAGGKQLTILKFSIVSAVLNILLNLILIPRFSYIGASWSTDVTQTFILLSNIYVSFLVLNDKKT